MKRFCVALALLLSLSGLVADARAAGTTTPPVAGVDYELLAEPKRLAPDAPIEVVQVFNYACGTCALFQPMLNDWKRQIDKDVRLVYVPAPFGGIFDVAANAYLSAEHIGFVEQSHDAIYKAVHVDHTLHTGELDEVANIYAGLGADREAFVAAFASADVKARLDDARQYAMAAGVTAVPTLIVNGKYKVSASKDRSLEDLLRVVDHLIEMERR